LFVAVSVAAARFFVAKSAPISADTPSVADREAVEKQLDAKMASDETQAALFVLEQSKASYDAVVTANGAIETKASSLLTTIAGAAGLLSLFGRFKDGSAQSGASPFLWLAILAAALTVLCCLYILRTKVRPFPSAAAYVRARTVWTDNSRFNIALELAEGYNANIIAIWRDRRYEGPAYYAAQIFVALAALALLTHFAIPSAPPATERTLNCKFVIVEKTKPSSLSCVEHGAS
jgi:hypothetical protein